MQNRNLHWTVRMEMCRRGGFRNEKRINPIDIDGMVRRLREENIKTEGIQPKKKVGKDTEVGSRQSMYQPGERRLSPPGLDSSGPQGQEVGLTPLQTEKQEGIHGLLGVTKEEDITMVRNRNQALPNAPGDFALFDFSEMEKMGNQLLNARDTWVHETSSAPALQYSGMMTTKQQEIENWWNARRPPIADELRTFIKNRMSIDDSSNDCEKGLRKALEFLSRNGTTRDSQLATSGLLGLESISAEQEKCDESLVGGKRSSIFRGPLFEMEDCSSQDIRVGNLHFMAVDYGDQLRLTESLQLKLSTGETWERNQCAVIEYSAGIEWDAQGRPSRRPVRKRIEVIATQMREQEYQRASETFAEVEWWAESGGKAEIERLSSMNQCHKRMKETSVL